MSSSQDSLGFALLNKWKASSSEIQVSFSTADSIALVTGKGVVIELSSDGQLLVESSKFRAFLNLSNASFETVITAEGIEQSGLSPEAYGESITISLPPLGKCELSALPRLQPAIHPNWDLLSKGMS